MITAADTVAIKAIDKDIDRDIETLESPMNTVDFVIGQLLSFEMMKLAKQRPHQHLIKRFFKESIMDTQLLFILFLVVSLIANFTVMAPPEK